MNPHLTTERHRRICDVHIVLVRDGRVLMSLRRGGYASGLWQVPSGHLEEEETTAEGAAREAGEEIGVRIEPGGLELAHFIDHRAPGEAPRLGVFYRARSWAGEPYNAEPAKCGGLAWYPLDAVPENTVPYHAAALAHIAEGRAHSSFGWETALT
jgi:8-oxo-dGTP diphosphatase